jgi:hypothetical protein
MCKFYGTFYVFFIIFFIGNNIEFIYKVESEGEASFTAHFSFVYSYPLPDGSRMNDRNIS